MGLTIKFNKNDIPLLEEGIYTGVCYGVIDLGRQYSEKYNKWAKKILFMWEIPDEKIVIDGEEKNRVLSQSYTASMHEKSNLRKVIESWRGKAFSPEETDGEFTLSDMLGKGCNLQIIHRSNGDKTYANISNIMSLKKGEEPPSLTLEPLIFDFSDVSTHEVYHKLPTFVRTTLEKSNDAHECEYIGVDTPEKESN